jgi:hypothetical protein
MRCLYNHAVADGYISEADKPARKVAKLRRLRSTPYAVPDQRLRGCQSRPGGDSVVQPVPFTATRPRRPQPTALGAAGAGLAIVYVRPPHMPAVLELLASAPYELSWAGTRGTCLIDLSEPFLGR